MDHHDVHQRLSVVLNGAGADDTSSFPLDLAKPGDRERVVIGRIAAQIGLHRFRLPLSPGRNRIERDHRQQADEEARR